MALIISLIVFLLYCRITIQKKKEWKITYIVFICTLLIFSFNKYFATPTLA